MYDEFPSASTASTVLLLRARNSKYSTDLTASLYCSLRKVSSSGIFAPVSRGGTFHLPLTHSARYLSNCPTQTCNRLFPSKRMRSSRNTSVLTSGKRSANMTRSLLRSSWRRSWSSSSSNELFERAVPKGFVRKASEIVALGGMLADLDDLDELRRVEAKGKAGKGRELIPAAILTVHGSSRELWCPRDKSGLEG